MKLLKPAFALAVTALLLGGCASTGGSTQTSGQPSKLSAAEKEKQRGAVLSFAQESLEKLYAVNPDTISQIESAPGYAVFDISAVNIIMFVGQTGKGVLVNNKTKAPTFMKAVRAGTGPGLGYREMRQIFVFKSEAAMEQFAVGNEAGGDVSAAVTVGKQGGQMSFNPYIDVYQITEKGFTLEAQWGGTVYVADPDLN